jgi:hypothetical protein
VTTALWMAVAFTAGVLCGAMWREAFEILRRKDELMRFKRLTSRVQQPNVLALALLVVLVINAAVGVLVIVNNHNQAGLVRCIAQYNEQAGTARDDRNAAVMSSSDAELANVEADLEYQKGLLSAFGAEQPLSVLRSSISDRIDANERYLKTLREQRQVRIDSQYPPPDLCGGTP